MTALSGDESYPDHACPEHGEACSGATCCCRDKHQPEPEGPWIVSELSLNMAGPPPEGQPHPERAPVGPFNTRREADSWAFAKCGEYGGGSWSLAPLIAPTP